LSAIGHQGVFRLTRWSSQIHTGFHGPRATWDPSKEVQRFRLQDFYPLWRPFPRSSTNAVLFYSLPVRQNWPRGPTTPVTQRLPAITRDWFGLFRFRSPLLTESRLLSLPAGTEMFHFPAFPPLTLCVQVRVTGHDSCRVSPFGNPRIKARLTAPRGLSQPPTSFIGSWCQGIHRAPLLTWLQQRCSRPLCSSQGAGGPGHQVLAGCHSLYGCERYEECPVLPCRSADRSKPAGAYDGLKEVPEAPTTNRGGDGSVPSGPNSVPGLTPVVLVVCPPCKQEYWTTRRR
jgi:hypothetical protein